MKVIILALFFLSFISISSECNTRMTDEEAVGLFDEAPEQELEHRELPWYLDIISVPGAQILVSMCNAWDWTAHKMNSLKKVCILLLQRMHLKKQDQEIKGAMHACS